LRSRLLLATLAEKVIAPAEVKVKLCKNDGANSRRN
jgi:hypothetical protein